MFWAACVVFNVMLSGKRPTEVFALSVPDKLFANAHRHAFRKKAEGMFVFPYWILTYPVFSTSVCPSSERSQSIKTGIFSFLLSERYMA